MNKTKASIGFTTLICCLIASAAMCNGLAGPALAQGTDPTPELNYKLYLPGLSGGTGSGTPPATITPTPTATQPAPTQTSTATATQPPPQSHPLPAPLIGLWWTGKLLPRELYDPVTGQWGNSNGLGQMYEFGANGVYTYTADFVIENPGCRSSVKVFKRGIASVDGASLKIAPNFGRTRTQISCGSQDVTIDESPGSPEMLPYAVSYDERGIIQLLLGSSASGTSTPATRYYKDGLAPELIGTWRNGGVTAAGFYDPATRTFTEQAGDGEWVRILANGSYQVGGFAHATDNQGCALTGWTYQEGTVTVSGSHITFNQASGIRRIESACDPGHPQEGPYTNASTGFSFEFIDRETAPKLKLWPDFKFENTVYERE